MKDVSLSFAIAAIVLGACCVVFSLRIEASALSGEYDPGPKALPMVLSGLLFAGGIASCVARYASRQRDAPTHAEEGGSDATGFGNAPVALGAFLAYVVAIDWLGFQLSTLAFVCGMLLWLGARWWSALLTALLVVVVVRFFFGALLYVQLPEGAFGIAL